MRSSIVRVGSYGLGVLIAVMSVGGHLSASVQVPVPEIDGGSFSVGLGLLSAGILILRSRRRSR
jgi:hypothetical protein